LVVARLLDESSAAESDNESPRTVEVARPPLDRAQALFGRLETPGQDERFELVAFEGKGSRLADAGLLEHVSQPAQPLNRRVEVVDPESLDSECGPRAEVGGLCARNSLELERFEQAAVRRR